MSEDRIAKMSGSDVALIKKLTKIKVDPIFVRPFSSYTKDELEELRPDAIKALFEMVSEHRAKHSLSVAGLCKKAAELNNIPAETAFFAGLFHDCAKSIHLEESKELMQIYFPNYVNHEVWMYHQFLGRLLAKEIIGFDDEVGLGAIEYHASGKGNMTPMQKLVYACDKIDPLRGYDSQFMIDAVNADIESGFALVLKENREFYRNKGKDINDSLPRECYEYYLGTYK